MDSDEAIERFDRLNRLRQLLERIDDSKVTLIGDTMLDRYHHGFANNLNSTAPVPVMKIFRTEESPGASAHIALGLSSLGIEVSYHCCVGDDYEGSAIVDMLRKEGISDQYIEIVKDRRTLTKIRFFGSRESLLENSQILLQADRGPQDILSEEVIAKLSDSALESLKDSCALVISDYDKGVINPAGATALIASAKLHEIPIIVDPKLTGLDKSKGATVVLFEIRGLDLLRRRLMLEDDTEAAKHLIETYEWDSLVVLGGIDGLTLYQSDGSSHYFPCMSPSPIQQIGLHDAAATALAAALGNGHNMLEASTLAAAACECILSAESSYEFIDKETLGLWLEELTWQMQISDR